MSEKAEGRASRPPVSPINKPTAPEGGLRPRELAASGRLVRAQRARVHRDISLRRLDPVAAADDPLMAGDRWLTFLKSVPGIGQRGAYGILHSAGVRDDARLRTTGRRQRAYILNVIRQRCSNATAIKGGEAA